MAFDPDRKWGATWIAMFRPQLIKLLQHVSKQKLLSKLLYFGPLKVPN